MRSITSEAQKIRAALFGFPATDYRSSTCLKDGCAARVTTYPQFCDEHGKEVYGCEVRPSSISGAGNGLFAVSDMEQGDTIDLYCGKCLSTDRNTTRHLAYGLQVEPAHYLIDAEPVWSCISRYINHSTNPTDGGRANCAFQNLISPNFRHQHVAVITTRAISAGEELLCYYGPDWQPVLDPGWSVPVADEGNRLADLSVVPERDDDGLEDPELRDAR